MTMPPDSCLERPVGLLTAARRYATAIITAALVAAVTAFAVTWLFPTRYEATARIVLVPRPDGEFGEYLGLGAEDSDYAQNQAAVVTSAPVFSRAVDLQDGRHSAARIERLADDVRVRARSGANVLVITVRHRSAHRAAERANAVARAYEQVMAERVRSRAAEAIVDLESQIAYLRAQLELVDRQLASVPPSPSDPAISARALGLAGEQSDLRTALRELEAQQRRIPRLAQGYGGGVELLDEAAIPDRPVSPQPWRNAGVSAFVVLAGGLAAAWWRSEQVPVVTSQVDLRHALDAQVLGDVPRMGKEALSGALSIDDGAVIDAFRLPVASLAPVDDGEATVVLVAGPRRGEGVTVSALNLAKAAAQAGRSVVLVDADLRERGLTRLLGLDGLSGFSDVAVGDTTLGVAAQYLHASAMSGLSVLPGGAADAEPGTVFSGAGFGETLAGLRRLADLVIIDGPAVLEASDAALAARHADAVVVVAAAGGRLDDLRQAKARLDLVGATIHGALLNHGASRRAGGSASR